MKEREYKGWEIIKLLEEGKLKDGTKINVIKKETKEKYVCGYVVYDNKIYHDSGSYFENDSPMVYSITPVAIEQFVSNNKFTIEKRIEYMTLQEAIATEKPLRLNEEWSKNIKDGWNMGIIDEQSEDYMFTEKYINGKYLYLPDMLIVLGWCFSRKELIDLFTSNKKVWCVEDVF